MGNGMDHLKSKVVHIIQEVQDGVSHTLDKVADKIEAAIPVKPLIISNSDINVGTVPDVVSSPPLHLLI